MGTIDTIRPHDQQPVPEGAPNPFTADLILKRAQQIREEALKGAVFDVSHTPMYGNSGLREINEVKVSGFVLLRTTTRMNGTIETELYGKAGGTNFSIEAIEPTRGPAYSNNLKVWSDDPNLMPRIDREYAAKILLGAKPE